MITGAHFLLYSSKAVADRRFLRGALGLRAVDAGDGWLIFALPPAELAVHPSSRFFAQRHANHTLLGAVLYLMCDDLRSTVRGLKRKRVRTTEIEQEEWGIRTTIRLPSGGELGLYQPTHRTAIRPRGGPKRR
jgi:hypothetical protein